MKAATLAMLSHLQSRLPWDDESYLQLTFLDPLRRAAKQTPEYGVGVARWLGRFTEEEQVKVAVQLNLYQAMPEDKVPAFTKEGRIDHYWSQVFKVLQDLSGEKQHQLERLVKLSCTISHGNAFLERGMSTTKRVVSGRNSLAEVGVKAQKVVKEVIRRHGGVTGVPITREVMASVSRASFRYRDELKKATEAEKEAERESAAEKEASKKRKAEEEDLRSWKDKKIELEEKTKASRKFIEGQERVEKEAMEKSLSLKSAAAMRTSVMAADMARQSIVKEGKKLATLQEQLVLHVGKKPRKS
jgi:hypothetical protein